MASDADAYERGVKISQTSLTPNFRDGVQANPWFQLGYQMGMKHGAGAAGMMSRAKSEFPAVAARLQASRPGAKDMMAGEDFAARLKSLITRFGFRPDEVSVSNRFGVGTISFKNQKGKATELVSKLRGAMKQSGVPESAITAREVQYPADEDGPAEHWGVVNVDFNKMPHSRPGAKARFKVEDRFYFGKGRKERFAENVTYSIAAHIGSQPVGHRSVDSLEQAKIYAKQMLEAFKPNAKGKPLLVEVYPVVNYSPQPAVLTLRG